MSTEPEREIEKTLRDYARHRQDTGGTPPALHPATRKLLQDEVSRQKTGERRTGGLSLFLASWPGFFLKGSVTLVVLVVGAFLLTPFWRGNLKQQPTQLAKNNVTEEKLREVPKKEVPPALTPPPPATAAPSSIASRKQSDEVATKALQKDLAANTPQPVERPRSNPVAAPVATAAPALSIAPVAAPLMPVPTVAPATPPVVATDTFTQPTSRTATTAYDFEKLGPVTQQYARVNPTPNRAGRGGGGAGGGAPNRQGLVLRSFRVEQNGGQIRVIDADGSIYTGTVTPGGNRTEASAATTAAAASALDQTKAKSDLDMANGVLKNPAAAFAATNAPVITGNMFRVRGTNLTLNQPVEFTGSFVANDQPLAAQSGFGGGAAAGGGRAGGSGGAISGGGFASAGTVDSLAQTNVAVGMAGNLGPTVATNPAPSPLANFRLQGEAVIGTNRVGINAVPTRP
jgi:hypothetical protein